MKSLSSVLLACGLLLSLAAHAEKITVAAASSLKFAFDEAIATFASANPGDTVEVVYGSSGRFYAQIRQGAPYEMFFSADTAYPQALAKDGFAASAVEPYALGRIVLWSASFDARAMTLASLAEPQITRVAIANPKHAPYGQAAEEALRASGLWERVEPKLVYGDSITHTAQFIQTGNAQVGIIALSLALSPELSRQGGYSLIPQNLHEPLEQGFVITRRGADSSLARRFAAYVRSGPVRALLQRYGFEQPTGASDD